MLPAGDVRMNFWLWWGWKPTRIVGETGRRNYLSSAALSTILESPEVEADEVLETRVGFAVGEPALVCDGASPIKEQVSKAVRDIVANLEPGQPLPVLLENLEEEEFGDASPRAGNTARRVHPKARGRYVAALVAELRTELPLLLTPRSKENYAVVSRKAAALMKAHHGLRTTEAARLLPLVVEAFFIPTSDDLLAADFARSRGALDRKMAMDAKVYDSYLMSLWPFRLFHRQNEPLSFVQ